MSPRHSIVLAKYQALGNDYLVLDLPGPLEATVAALPALCDRHRGLGADGLIAFDPGTLAVRIFNPDRSEAEKSGNGLRIAAAHAVLAHGAPARFGLTAGGRLNEVRVLAVEGGQVTCELNIGPASFEPDEPITLQTAAGSVRCLLVSVGNPHCVVFDQPVTAGRAQELGPLLERHPHFPNRTNVQLVEPLGRDRARIEIWERGAGYTLASGTSAGAVAAGLIHQGLADSAVTIEMPGGTLNVRQQVDGALVQSGPTRRVYTAEVDLTDL